MGEACDLRLEGGRGREGGREWGRKEERIGEGGNGGGRSGGGRSEGGRSEGIGEGRRERERDGVIDVE